MGTTLHAIIEVRRGELGWVGASHIDFGKDYDLMFLLDEIVDVGWPEDHDLTYALDNIVSHWSKREAALELMLDVSRNRTWGTLEALELLREEKSKTDALDLTLNNVLVGLVDLMKMVAETADGAPVRALFYRR